MRWISSENRGFDVDAGDAGGGRGLTASRAPWLAHAGSGAADAGAPALQSIGPLAFGPDGVLFAADRQAATIYAIDLGAQATGGAPGAKDVAGIDKQIAAMLGTEPAAVQVTDLAVHPASQERVHRGDAGDGRRGQAGAAPRRRRGQARRWWRSTA